LVRPEIAGTQIEETPLALAPPPEPRLAWPHPFFSSFAARGA
jgi:hypothetical protein